MNEKVTPLPQHRAFPWETTRFDYRQDEESRMSSSDQNVPVNCSTGESMSHPIRSLNGEDRSCWQFWRRFFESLRRSLGAICC